ncbi:MAG: hypothetical protein WC261_12740 [Synergistaceae bacterium]|nr:hypothetical protein [Thermotogota bacterium]HOF24416.1 hypothetical protein [Thermotogota bacterium]
MTEEITLYVSKNTKKEIMIFGKKIVVRPITSIDYAENLGNIKAFGEGLQNADNIKPEIMKAIVYLFSKMIVSVEGYDGAINEEFVKSFTPEFMIALIPVLVSLVSINDKERSFRASDEKARQNP